jgi:HEAT repeat protein
MADHGFVHRSVVRWCTVVTLMVAVGVGSAGQARAQGPPPSASLEIQRLGDGWAAFRQGNLAQAAQIAEQLVAEFPRSAGVVALAIEVDIRRGGVLAGLASYERWLGSRRVDAPYALRRIAQAHLEAIAANPSHGARIQAARSLAADGNVAAREELAKAAANGGVAETQMLASLGDTRAVRDLVAQLQIDGGGKARIIAALVESRSPLAVPPLMDLLGNHREEQRAAAAEALGKLGAVQAVPRLQALLNDPAFPVRLAAASALYRLENHDGMNLLSELLSSEHGTIRLAVAEALAVRPPATWSSIVRELTRHEDAMVQLGAARLIAPYEPELAAEVLARLGQSDNPAVREEAGRAFVERLAADFATLRRYLRSTDGPTSVRAAARILELTR